MKRVAVLVLCIVFLFCSLGTCFAGVLNNPKNLVDLIEKLEPKAGYSWLKHVEPEGRKAEWYGSFQGAIYTFKAEKEDEAVRIGSIDVGYADESKFYVSTMVDVKILDVLNIELPFGAIELMGGLDLGLDCNDGIQLDLDKVMYGCSAVGKFTFKF